MQTPLEISFQNIDHSEAVESAVRQRAEKLEQLSNEITSCHVFIKEPHKRHSQGNQFEVHIEVRLPGKELAVSSNPGDVNAHEDAYVTIRDAFNAMERQIKKWKEIERGHRE